MRALPATVVSTLAEVVQYLGQVRDAVNLLLRRVEHGGLRIADASNSPMVIALTADPRTGSGQQAIEGTIGVVVGTADWYKKTGPAPTQWSTTGI